MSISDKEIERYISQIKKNMLCPASKRKTVLEDLKNSVSDYVQEHNVTSIDEVYSHFGKPEVIALQLAQEIEPQKIKNKLNLRKVLIVGIALALVIFAVALIIIIIDSNTATHGYYVETLTTEQEQIISAYINSFKI